MKRKGIFGVLCIIIIMIMSVCLFGNSSNPAHATSTSTLYLNGSNYLETADSLWLNPPTAITLEAWVKLPADNVNCMTIISKYYVNNYWLGLCDRYPRFYAAGSGTRLDASAQVPVGEWTHIAATYDGSTSLLYINGILRGSIAISDNLINNDYPVRIGDDPGPTSFRFIGAIADVRLWAIARTVTQIRQDMVRLPDAGQAELWAAWALEGGGKDLFGRVDMTEVNMPAWNGGTAPPFLYDPIQIPRLAAAPSSISNCVDSYNGALRVPIWYWDAHSAPNPVWVSIGATATDLYVCFDRVELTTEFTGLYLDSDNSGGTYADSFDTRLIAHHEGSLASFSGDGAGGFDNDVILIPGWDGVFSQLELYARVGYRFPRSWLGSGGLFRMMFNYHWLNNIPGNDYYWSLGSVWNSPATWKVFHINDGSVPPADNQVPKIQLRYSPSPLVRAGQTVTIHAGADDDVDIAQLDIYVDGSIQRSCTFAGASDTSVSCDYAFVPVVGQHTYYGHVIDQRGRSAYSSLDSFFAQIDGRAPTISLSHSPRSPMYHQSFLVTAEARDPSGIAELRIIYDYYPFSTTCPVSGNPVETCLLTLSPSTQQIVRYWAWTRDNEGQITESPRIPVLLGNFPIASDPDSDNDGIVNSLETRLGTDPYNLDTDRDALMDGWEVQGVQFGDGYFINLPAMGANPLRKNIFVQYDYERGAHIGPLAWPYAINLFRSHAIDLSVTEIERPRTGITSTLTAEDAAATLDGSGHYYFNPKMSLTHHYVFSRHNLRRSYAWHFVTLNIDTGGDCPMSSSDPQNDPNCMPHYNGHHVPRYINSSIYLVVHELGHSLGLGHGGRLGDNTQTRFGDVISYDGGGGRGNDTNQKPNYLSIMNYRYSRGPRICIDNVWGNIVGDYDYDIASLPHIDETNINETSLDFRDIIANFACPPGSHAGITYSCVDSSGHRQMRATDGEHVFLASYEYYGSLHHEMTPWSTPGINSMVTGGIDWDCDNTLEPSVHTNVNGDGGEDPAGNGSNNDDLYAYNDWAGIPFTAGHGCYIRRENPSEIPLAYKQLISSADCRTSMASYSPSSHTTIQQLRESDVVAIAPEQPVVEDDSFVPPMPNLEICNGLDDDNDQQIDEGCPDRDYDGIVDALDNCPDTWNYDQADLDGNHLGDACQYPQVSDLSITSDGVARTLDWNVSSLDVLGYDIYRQCFGESSLKLLQAEVGDYPTIDQIGYQDGIDGRLFCSYCVAAVNPAGQEGDSICAYQFPVYLPAIRR